MRRVPFFIVAFFLPLIGLISCSGADEGSEPEKSSVSENDESEIAPYIPIDTTHIADRPFSSFDQPDLKKTVKDSMVQHVKDHYGFYASMYGAEDDPPLAEKFTVLELNDDEHPDLVYQGWSGGEPDLVSFHLGSDTGFSEPIKFHQYTKSISGSSGSGIEWLTIYDPGCCADPVRQEATCTFNKEAKRDTLYHRAWIGGIQYPEEIDEHPKEFRVQRNDRILRNAPKADDSTVGLVDPAVKGNRIAVLDRSNTGKIWGSYSSEKKEWVFVEMDPVRDSLESDMFSYHDYGELRRMGWMKGEGIRKSTRSK